MNRRHLTLTAALAALALPLVGAPAAPAAPAVAGEFAVSAQPGQLALGPDGNVWVALDGVARDLARVAPDGTVTEFTTAGVTNPVGIAAGPDGNLWLTQAGGVARVAPAAPTLSTVFPVADIADPRAITAGPDGNLWTASGDKAIRVTPAGAATSFTVAGMGARGIARGGDGRLWIADFGGARIVALSTASVPAFTAVGGGPQELAAGPGGQVAYTNPGAVPQTVGRIAAAGGAAATTPTPGADPFGIALGADGAWWTANFATSTLTRLSAEGEATTLTGLSPASGPRYIAAGTGGTLWVSLQTASKIARVTGVEPPAPPPPPPPPTPPEEGPSEAEPDTAAPVVAEILAKRKVRRGRVWRMRLTLDEPATLGVNWWTGRDVVAFKKIRAQAGQTVVRLRSGRLSAGRHKVTLVARDAAGNVTELTALRLRVLPRRPR
ncbi:MAG TPA: hypothetical protein VIL49_06985 [Capillimicrobium sp.]